MKKINVGLFFGGVSTEHEVSRWSAVHVLKSLDKDKFCCTLFEINKAGELLSYKETEGNLDSFCNELIRIDNSLSKEKEVFSTDLVDRYSLDVIFPVLHGTGGEDGILQGLFELFDIPYVGAAAAGSAVAFDKVFTKEILAGKGITQAAYEVASTSKIHEDTYAIADNAGTILGFPIFVKPANGGSSVGIFKAKDRNALIDALKKASKYDRKIVMEESIQGRELECAVIGGYEKARALGVGEVIPCNEFYDYNAKYLDNDSEVIVPAELSKDITEKIMEIAVEAFKAVDSYGLARIDFFLGDNGKIYLNEVNTMPGFTSISMYPKLWRYSGGSDSALITELIDLAYERKDKYKYLKDYTQDE